MSIVLPRPSVSHLTMTQIPARPRRPPARSFSRLARLHGRPKARCSDSSKRSSPRLRQRCLMDRKEAVVRAANGRYEIKMVARYIARRRDNMKQRFPDHQDMKSYPKRIISFSISLLQTSGNFHFKAILPEKPHVLRP